MRVDEGETTLWFFTDWSSPKVDDIHHDVRARDWREP
jgi:general stress protein 26